MREKYNISGMTCSACSKHVEKTVKKLAGIKDASVNLLANTMTVEYDGSKTTSAEISKAVKNAGYGASLLKAGKGGRTGKKR